MTSKDEVNVSDGDGEKLPVRVSLEFESPISDELPPESRPDTQRLVPKLTNFLRCSGVETHGITPIPPEQRDDTRLYQMFFVWFSANMNCPNFSLGTAGPAFFKLGLQDTLVILTIVDVMACIVPAFFAIFGPKLGTRAMVQARFSWGYYGAIIPSILNVVSLQGFLISNCMIGGQIIASVSPHLNDTFGIVIIGMISLVVTFCGYRVIHWVHS